MPGTCGDEDASIRIRPEISECLKPGIAHLPDSLALDGNGDKERLSNQITAIFPDQSVLHEHEKYSSLGRRMILSMHSRPPIDSGPAHQITFPVIAVDSRFKA